MSDMVCLRLRTFVAARLRTAAAPMAIAALAVALTHVSGTAFAQGAAAPPAAAQSDADGTHVEEVVVTARFRKESLQETPIAMTALTGAQLERQGVTNIEQVAQSAPNVVLQQGPGEGGRSLVAFIRGVGQSQFLFALQPGVGIYIDDVYQATAFGSILDLIDVDRVEVLRGPQGTLFGRNSEGGAIRIYSQKPTGEGDGYVSVGYGNFNHEEIRGAYDIALVPDTVFFRVSGAEMKTDGYMKTYDFACANPGQSGSLKPLTQSQGCRLGTEGGDDVKSLRGALRWLAGPGLEVNVIADMLDDQGEPPADKLISIQPNYPGSTLGLYNSQVLMPRFGVAADNRFVTNNPYSSYATYQDPVSGVSVTNPQSDNFEYGITGVVDWDPTHGIHVKSITAYRNSSGTANQTEPLPVSPLGPETTILNHHQFSEELDISGTLPLLGRDLDWTVGGYYFRGESRQQGFTVLSYLLPLLGSYNFQTNDPASDNDYSGFLHGVYHVTDKLSLEGGYRYTAESQGYTFFRLLKPQDTYLFPITSESTSSSRGDYRAGLQYQWTRTVMTYGSVSTGFKAGGFNPLPEDAAQVTSFKPETLTAYEVGAKTEFFDRRLRTNLALFRSEYKNLQSEAYTYDLTGIPAFEYINVGKARIQGVELEVTAEPVRALLLNAAVGYLDYRTISLGSAGLVPNGPLQDAPPALIPKDTFSAGVQYTFPLGQVGSLTPRADLSYKSRVYADQRGTFDTSQGGYALLNGHLMFTPRDSKWQVTGEVLNALGKVYYTLITDSRTADGIVDGLVGQPREFKIVVRRDF